MKNNSSKFKPTYRKAPVENIASMIIQLRQEKKALIEGRKKEDFHIQDRKEHKYKTKLLEGEYQTVTEKGEIINPKEDDHEDNIVKEKEKVNKEESNFHDKIHEEIQEISEEKADQNYVEQENSTVYDNTNLEEDTKNIKESMLKEGTPVIENIFYYHDPKEVMEKLCAISKTRKK